MSDLIVIGYADPAVAEQAGEQVKDLDQLGVLKLAGLALLRVDENGQSHLDVDTPTKIAGITTPAAAVFGAVLGFLLFAPLGAVVGGAIGAGAGGLWGVLRQHGVDDQFRRGLEESLVPGSAALIVMAAKIDDARFAESLGPFGGHVIRTSLDDETEQDLVDRLTGQRV
ncbi:MAG TPA: DUF1269 domain-containing protein [Actinocrinis sp.]|jgi:uncharacterized membrane protein